MVYKRLNDRTTWAFKACTKCGGDMHRGWPDYQNNVYWTCLQCGKELPEETIIRILKGEQVCQTAEK